MQHGRVWPQKGGDQKGLWEQKTVGPESSGTTRFWSKKEEGPKIERLCFFSNPKVRSDLGSDCGRLGGVFEAWSLTNARLEFPTVQPKANG